MLLARRAAGDAERSERHQPSRLSHNYGSEGWRFEFCHAQLVAGLTRPVSQVPKRLDPDLIEEGRAIPVARVQAMHEGKRRKRGV